MPACAAKPPEPQVSVLEARIYGYILSLDSRGPLLQSPRILFLSFIYLYLFPLPCYSSLCAYRNCSCRANTSTLHLPGGVYVRTLDDLRAGDELTVCICVWIIFVHACARSLHAPSYTPQMKKYIQLLVVPFLKCALLYAHT